MAKKRLLAAAVAAVFLATQTPVALAGAMTGGSTEVTQILNNVQLAMQTIKQYAQHLTTLQQLKVDMLQQMAGSNIFASEEAKALMRTVSAIQGAQTDVSNLYGSIDHLKNVTNSRFTQFAASGLDWQQYVNREVALAQHQKQTAGFLNAAEIAAMKRVQANWDLVQQTSGAIARSEGTHDSLQQLNGQMSSLIGTMTEILRLDASNSMADTQKDTEEAALRESRARTEEEIFKRMTSSHANSAKLLKDAQAAAAAKSN